MRHLGLDIGTVRIGVALSDASARIATPLTTVPAKPPAAAVRAIVALLAKHDIQQIVVGLPLELSGAEGRAVRRTRKFLGVLKAATEIPIAESDERMSSAVAERALLEGDVSRRGRKQRIDKVAAAVILQTYLDGANSRC